MPNLFYILLVVVAVLVILLLFARISGLQDRIVSLEGEIGRLSKFDDGANKSISEIYRRLSNVEFRIGKNKDSAQIRYDLAAFSDAFIAGNFNEEEAKQAFAAALEKSRPAPSDQEPEVIEPLLSMLQALQKEFSEKGAFLSYSLIFPKRHRQI